MPDYRRAFCPGGTFFFTVVTHRRRRFLSRPIARDCLRVAVEKVASERPFETLAFVVLADHLHCIWRLPDGDSDFSVRWACIKKSFSQLWLAAGGHEGDVSRARQEHRERGIWQRRFWEHTIRDQNDLTRHVNYIHYNPVRHGLAKCPHEWPVSSFHQWVKEGYYEADWLCNCNLQRAQGPDFNDIKDTVGE